MVENNKKIIFYEIIIISYFLILFKLLEYKINHLFEVQCLWKTIGYAEKILDVTKLFLKQAI